MPEIELTFLTGDWKVKALGKNMYQVNHYGKEYTVDAEFNTCSCSDYLYRGYTSVGHECKHMRFVTEALLAQEREKNR